MEKHLTRKEYIESELSKWKEKYEVGFEEEFDLRAMFDLQYQFAITNREHVKSLGDIIHTKNQILKNLILKPKSKIDNNETWIFDLSYDNHSTVKFKLTQIKIEETTGKTVIRNFNRRNDTSSLRVMASNILNEVKNNKPKKILFDKNGVGMGLFEQVMDLIKSNDSIKIKDNGEILYKNK